MKKTVQKTLATLALIVAMMTAAAAGVQAQTVNMSRYITLTIQSGQQIRLDLRAAASNTPVRIVSGSNTQDITVGTSWTGVQNYTSDGTTMTVYGDITGFICRYNGANVTSLDVSHNTTLTSLYCTENQLSSLDVSGCTDLIALHCDWNNLSSLDVSGCTALTTLYCSSNKLTSLDVSSNTALTKLYCSSNKLTSLDVSSNTALTELYCYNNQLTSLDVSNNTALTELYCSSNKLTSLDVSSNRSLIELFCYGNNMDACALDALFRSLPQRQTSDNAKVYIKNGSYTNPGAGGCRTPIANAKNWKVMDCNNDSSNSIEINNSNFSCQETNLSRYITLTVQSGQQISLDFKAAAPNTPVRIVSGSNTQDITVGTSWVGNRNYTTDGTTMTVYGNVTEFECENNAANITSLNANNNTALTVLYCRGNSLSSLNVSECTDLTKLSCFGNRLSFLDVSRNTALTELYCYGNSLSSLDVSRNTVLTTLNCSGNRLTSLDISRNTALTTLNCSGNNMDACALDALFRSLPDRQTSDNAKVYIKNGTSTNPGADGCRTPIANAKNWKVMDYNGAPSNSIEIDNSTFTCVPNMNRYITLTVRSGQQIRLDFKAAAPNTPVRIVSGSNTQDTIVGTSWTGFQNYTSDGTTMKVYGDIRTFNCGGNGANVTSLDVSNNRALTYLDCNNNQLTALDVSGCTALTELYCDGNNMNACALDALFRSLPARKASDNAKVYIKNGSSSNPGADGCRTPIAKDKNWKVMDFNGAPSNSTEINNNNFTCREPNPNSYITLTVQSGQHIRLDLRAAASNTPVRIVSGSNTQDITVGTSWTGVQNYTSDGTTMTVYGDITEFDCNSNGENVTSLDVSNNTALTTLDCYGNRLSSLDVSSNGALTKLDCSSNKLTSLDVSNNTALTKLDCSRNKLTSLDVSSNTKLTRLFCEGNSMDACALDVLFRSLPNRQTSDDARVYIKNGTSTNPGADGCRTPIAKDKNWKVMDFNGAPSNSTEINNSTFTCVPNMSRYITLTVEDGEEIELDFMAALDGIPVRIVSGSNTQDILITTDLLGSQYYTADGTTITVYGDITGFDCRGNNENITALDVSRNTALTELYCSRNYINSLNITGCTALAYLSCDYNSLSSLDVSGFTDLTELNCDYNSLTSLDVSGCTALTELSCNNNQLTSLDVSGFTALTKLYCSDNRLTALDISGCTALTKLSCNNNQLTALDVRGCTDLTELSCNNNQLTALDVRGFNALTKLYCGSNQLTSLDVSGCTALTNLYCHENNFSTAALDAIYCALPDRSGKEEGKIQPVFNASSTNHATVLATTKGNATAKNWKVQYFSNKTDIPATTGSHTCATSVRNVPAAEAVRLYPNPVENVLYIKAEDEVRSIHIYNVYGAEVASAVATSEISLAHLPAGVYAVRIETDRGIATQRVVKH